MKKLVLLIAAVLLLNPLYSLAQTATQATLGKIEDSLYGFQYDNESDLARLSRLENTVYGQTSSRPQAERLAKLSKDISADSIGKEIEPVEDTFAENSDYIEEEPVAASDVSYPAVDELEQKVFNQTYPKQDIKTRLSNLEKKTFNKTYSDDLSARVDRLKAEIKPQSLMDDRMAQSSNVFYDSDVPPIQQDYYLGKYVPPSQFDYEAYNDMNNRRGQFYDDPYASPYHQDSYSPAPSYSSSPKKVSLSTIEKKLLHHNYAQDSIENRLSRLENVMFGTEFTSDDTQTRLDRLSSAYQAQKSASKYDSNRFSQNVGTAIQIGTLLLMVLACIL